MVRPSRPLPPLHHAVLAGRGAASRASAAARGGRAAEAAAPSPGALLALLLRTYVPGACTDCKLAAEELPSGCGTGVVWCRLPLPTPCQQQVRTSPGALGSGHMKPLVCELHSSSAVRGTAGCASGAQRGCVCFPGQAPLTHKRF